MAKTYEPISSTTLTSTQTSVTFSSISGSYTDLVLIMQTINTTNVAGTFQLNGDTGTNYSYTQVWGPTSSAGYTQRAANISYTDLNEFASGVSYNFKYVRFLNYSNSNAYKGTLHTSSDNTNNRLYFQTSQYRSNTAITSITISQAGFMTGSTFTLYGIKAA